MLPKISESHERKEKKPTARFLLRNEAGALYLLTSSWIDSYFLEKKTAFVSACVEHSKLVCEYHTLLAYKECERLPEAIVMKTTKLFQNEKRSFLKRYAFNELDRLMSIVEEKIISSEQKHGIGAFTTPEQMCLKWMNNFYSSSFERWKDIESMKISFRKEDREFLVTSFIAGAINFRDQIYFPQIEKMMNKAQKEMISKKRVLEKDPLPFSEAKTVAFEITKEKPNVKVRSKYDGEKEAKLSKVELKEDSKSKSKSKGCCVC